MYLKVTRNYRFRDSHSMHSGRHGGVGVLSECDGRQCECPSSHANENKLWSVLLRQARLPRRALLRHGASDPPVRFSGTNRGLVLAWPLVGMSMNFEPSSSHWGQAFHLQPNTKSSPSLLSPSNSNPSKDTASTFEIPSTIIAHRIAFTTNADLSSPTTPLTRYIPNRE